jgi:hypothetical protein
MRLAGDRPATNCGRDRVSVWVRADRAIWRARTATSAVDLARLPPVFTRREGPLQSFAARQGTTQGCCSHSRRR